MATADPTPTSAPLNADANLDETARQDEPAATVEQGHGAAGGNQCKPSQTRSLKSLAIRGSAWTVIGFVGHQTARLANNIVLAWVLTPAILGMMSLVRVIMQGLEMCSDLGLGPSIIQHERGDDPAFLNTAWTIQVIRGAMLWIACLVIALPLGLFYKEPQLYWIIPAVGISALIGGFNSTSLFTLNRRMALAKLKIIELSVFLFTVSTMIVAALITRSIWGIVFGWLLGSIARLIVSHAVNDGAPHRFQWDNDARRELYSFGKWIFLSTVITFLAGQMDRPILGKLVTWHDLGVYNVAMVVAIMPQQIGSQLCAFVLFPVLANRARERRQELQADVLRARRAILPLGVLTTMGVALVSPTFFRLLYDDRYHHAGATAQLLMIPMWFTILQASADRALLAVGDSRSLMISNSIRFIGSTAGCIGGFMIWGLPGFVLGLSLGTLFGHLVIQIALSRHGIQIVKQDLIYTAGCAALGVIGVLGPDRLAKQIDGVMDPSIFRLASGTLVLAATTLWTVHRVRRELFAR